MFFPLFYQQAVRQRKVVSTIATATSRKSLTTTTAILANNHHHASARVVSHHRPFSAAAATMASLIKQLRAETGAPISDCQKALKNNGQNLDEAKDWLRKHSTNKITAKVTGRSQNDGLIGLQISNENKRMALVKVTSETDFASRSPEFIHLVQTVASATLNNNSGETENHDILQTKVVDDDNDNNTTNLKTLQDVFDETILSIRENLNIVNTISRQVQDDGIMVGYVHNKVDNNACGTSAAVVTLKPITTTTPTIEEEIQTIGKKLSMHIVALKTASSSGNDDDEEEKNATSTSIYLSRDQVPPDVVAKEEEIIIEQLKQQKKPDDLIAKIMPGKWNSFYKTVCLNEQNHMLEEGNPIIGEFLKDHGLELIGFDTLSV